MNENVSKSEIIKLHTEGHSYRQISQMLGITKYAVSKALGKVGSKKNPNSFAEGECVFPVVREYMEREKVSDNQLFESCERLVSQSTFEKSMTGEIPISLELVSRIKEVLRITEPFHVAFEKEVPAGTFVFTMSDSLGNSSTFEFKNETNLNECYKLVRDIVQNMNDQLLGVSKPNNVRAPKAQLGEPEKYRGFIKYICPIYQKEFNKNLKEPSDSIYCAFCKTYHSLSGLKKLHITCSHCGRFAYYWTNANTNKPLVTTCGICSHEVVCKFDRAENMFKGEYFMEVLKFFNEFNRMCKTFVCSDCPLCGRNGLCRVPSSENMEEVVSIVEKWSKEHPQKTRLDYFKEKYPNARMYIDGTPKVCCLSLGYVCNCGKTTCEECWNMPLEEE